MQIELGAPIARARRSPVGVLPLVERVGGSGGATIVNMRRNLPSVSNTWMRRLARSPTQLLLLRSLAIVSGVRKCPAPVPRSPHDYTQLPRLPILSTREW